MELLKTRRSRMVIMLAAAAVFVALALLEAFPAPRWPRQEPDVDLGSRAAPWSRHIRDVDRALASHDVRTALFAWRAAHATALGSSRWDGLLAVGDAYLRIGDAAEYRRAFVPQASASYLLALERAQRASSTEGVIRAGKALAALGEHAEPAGVFSAQR
jgi:hypothetical protein